MFAVTSNSVPDFDAPDLKWHTSHDEEDAQPEDGQVSSEPAPTASSEEPSPEFQTG